MYHRRGADLGSVLSQINLGNHYFHGRGIAAENFQEENHKIAFDLFEKAARAGNDLGQYRLAICYRNGYGTVQNCQKVQEYYELAANQGLAIAKTELDEFTTLIYNYTKPEEMDRKKLTIFVSSKLTPHEIEMLKKFYNVLHESSQQKKSII